MSQDTGSPHHSAIGDASHTQRDTTADAFADHLHRSLAHGAVPAGNELQPDELADLALLREAIESYKNETLCFAEAKSAAMPVPQSGRAGALWHSTPRWALAVAALLVAGTTSFTVAHLHQPAAAITVAAPTPQTICEDDRLLRSVDRALNTTSPTEEDLGLSTIPAQDTKPERSSDD